MKSNHGMSVVLRVIVTGVVLIMIAMTVVFIGTGGLRRVAGPKGTIEKQSSTQMEEKACMNSLNRACRAGMDGGKVANIHATVEGKTISCSTVFELSKFTCTPTDEAKLISK